MHFSCWPTTNPASAANNGQALPVLLPAAVPVNPEPPVSAWSPITTSTTSLMQRQPTIKKLAPSRSRAEFFQRLGWSEHNRDHMDLYIVMMVGELRFVPGFVRIKILTWR